MAAGTGLLKRNPNQNDPSQNANFRPMAQPSTLPGGFDLTFTPQQLEGMNQTYNPINSYLDKQQQGPYRGGLYNTFRGASSFDGYDRSNRQEDAGAAMYDRDNDVRGAAGAQAALDEESRGGTGVDGNAQLALLNMYKGRIATKNSLAESIQGAAGTERKQEDLLTGAAGQSLGEGIKSTRQNYNNRGLLYSGLRGSGEQQVKAGVASGLDSAISGSRRESANAVSAAKNAYAAVDLANAQESLSLAHQAFDTASANNIARLQAMQQLGRGVGSVAGTVASNYSSKPAAAAGPSGPSNYNTDVTGNHYDYSGGDINSRTA